MTIIQMADKTVNLNIRISEETRDKLKRKARKLGKTYSELINNWIEQFIEKGEEVSPNNDEKDYNDITQKIEGTKSEMEEKIENLRKEYQSNDEKDYNDIIKNISEIRKKVEAIEQAQGRSSTIIDEVIALYIEGRYCDIRPEVSKIEQESPSEEDDDQQEVEEKQGGSESNVTEYSQNKLAKRLGASSDTIKKRIRQKQDEEWSRNKDPDGFAWYYDEEKKLYVTKDDVSEGAITSSEDR